MVQYFTSILKHSSNILETSAREISFGVLHEYFSSDVQARGSIYTAARYDKDNEIPVRFLNSKDAVTRKRPAFASAMQIARDFAMT